MYSTQYGSVHRIDRTGCLHWISIVVPCPRDTPTARQVNDRHGDAQPSRMSGSAITAAPPRRRCGPTTAGGLPARPPRRCRSPGRHRHARSPPGPATAPITIVSRRTRRPPDGSPRPCSRSARCRSRADRGRGVHARGGDPRRHLWPAPRHGPLRPTPVHVPSHHTNPLQPRRPASAGTTTTLAVQRYTGAAAHAGGCTPP